MQISSSLDDATVIFLEDNMQKKLQYRYANKVCNIEHFAD